MGWHGLECMGVLAAGLGQVTIIAQQDASMLCYSWWERRCMRCGSLAMGSGRGGSFAAG